MLNSVAERSDQIQSMFGAIAPRYDLLNGLLSCGLDRRWRRIAVEWLAPEKNWRILDVATGTADVALEILEAHPDSFLNIEGMDFSRQMLTLAQKKTGLKQADGMIRLQAGAAEALPYSDQTFDGLITAFGVRNFGHLQSGLKEMYRVLKPGGHVVILEFSLPRNFILKQVYQLYFFYVLPVIGRWISGHPDAYQYLPESVQEFPVRERFISCLKNEGFTGSRFQDLTFGVVTVYLGIKPDNPA